MSEDIPPLPNTPSWRSARLKHRDKFTFTFNREEVAEGWRKLHKVLLNLVGSIRYNWGDEVKENEVGGTCSTHAIYTKFWSETLKETDKQNGKVWTGFIWFRTGTTSGGFL
jgi:hypothetical protein